MDESGEILSEVEIFVNDESYGMAYFSHDEAFDDWTEVPNSEALDMIERKENDRLQSEQVEEKISASENVDGESAFFSGLQYTHKKLPFDDLYVIKSKVDGEWKYMLVNGQNKKDKKFVVSEDPAFKEFITEDQANDIRAVGATIENAEDLRVRLANEADAAETSTQVTKSNLSPVLIDGSVRIVGERGQTFTSLLADRAMSPSDTKGMERQYLNEKTKEKFTLALEPIIEESTDPDAKAVPEDMRLSDEVADEIDGIEESEEVRTKIPFILISRSQRLYDRDIQPKASVKKLEDDIRELVPEAPKDLKGMALVRWASDQEANDFREFHQYLDSNPGTLSVRLLNDKDTGEWWAASAHEMTHDQMARGLKIARWEGYYAVADSDGKYFLEDRYPDIRPTEESEEFASIW